MAQLSSPRHLLRTWPIPPSAFFSFPFSPLSFSPACKFSRLSATVRDTSLLCAMRTLIDPPTDRFQNRVAFDNVPLGEATKNNTPSFTLNVKHRGYRAGRRSRTFMVGVDEHAYSDYALQWLLDELVDDGDEIVCVRVIESGLRVSDKQYQEEAQSIMRSILQKNGASRALSFILEYAVGKLHGTFQKLVCVPPPSSNPHALPPNWTHKDDGTNTHRFTCMSLRC